MTEELLNLSTIVQHDTVNIVSKLHKDGKLYDLATLADLGPYEYAVIVDRNAEFDQLKKLTKLTPTQQRRVAKVLDEIVTLVLLGVEPSVLKALTEKQKQMIVLTWAASLNNQGAAEGNRRSRRTTAASPPGSKRSTAATRRRGSTRRTTS